MKRQAPKSTGRATSLTAAAGVCSFRVSVVDDHDRMRASNVLSLTLPAQEG